MSQETTSSEPIEGIVMDVSSSNAWERLENEPTEWYSRFQTFMLMGSGRSVNETWRFHQAERATRSHEKPLEATKSHVFQLPGNWKDAVRRFDWWARASAYDIEKLEEDKRRVEADRASRRKEIIEQDWRVGKQLVDVGSEALKHGNKFVERTTRLIPGKPVLKTVIHPRTGKEVEMLVQVDREVVTLELKASDIARLIDVGSRKQRQSVNLVDPKVQEEFVNRVTGEVVDVAALDAELFAIFEELGANNYRPPALPAPDVDDLPDIEGPPDDLWEAGS